MSQHFHLPPPCETHELTVITSLNPANLNIINISSLESRIWQHLEDHWNRTPLYHLVNIPSVPVDQLYKQMINSNGPIKFLHGHIFPYRHLCYGYRIAHTSRIRDILLLLFLMLTCQISVPTFTIKFYMIYHCG